MTKWRVADQAAGFWRRMPSTWAKVSYPLRNKYKPLSVRAFGPFETNFKTVSDRFWNMLKTVLRHFGLFLLRFLCYFRGDFLVFTALSLSWLSFSSPSLSSSLGVLPHPRPLPLGIPASDFFFFLKGVSTTISFVHPNRPQQVQTIPNFWISQSSSKLATQLEFLQQDFLKTAAGAVDRK